MKHGAYRAKMVYPEDIECVFELPGGKAIYVGNL